MSRNSHDPGLKGHSVRSGKTWRRVSFVSTQIDFSRPPLVKRPLWCGHIVSDVSITSSPAYSPRLDTYRWTRTLRDTRVRSEWACVSWCLIPCYLIITLLSTRRRHFVVACFRAQLNYSGNDSIANYSFPLERRHRDTGSCVNFPGTRRRCGFQICASPTSCRFSVILSFGTRSLCVFHMRADMKASYWTPRQTKSATARTSRKSRSRSRVVLINRLAAETFCSGQCRSVLFYMLFPGLHV